MVARFYTKTIAAENTFTDPLQLDPGEGAAISITSTLVASTLFLQRRFNPSGTWRDVASYTAIAEIDYNAAAGMEIRLGIKTGGYGGADSVIIDIRTSGRGL